MEKLLKAKSRAQIWMGSGILFLTGGVLMLILGKVLKQPLVSVFSVIVFIPAILFGALALKNFVVLKNLPPVYQTLNYSGEIGSLLNAAGFVSDSEIYPGLLRKSEKKRDTYIWLAANQTATLTLKDIRFPRVLKRVTLYVFILDGLPSTVAESAPSAGLDDCRTVYLEESKAVFRFDPFRASFKKTDPLETFLCGTLGFDKPSEV